MSLVPCLPYPIPTTCGLRHVRLPHRTTIRLERQFWAQFELLANKTGRSWRELVELELATKPAGHGAASWLRIRCLQLTQEGIQA